VRVGKPTAWLAWGIERRRHPEALAREPSRGREYLVRTALSSSKSEHT